MVKAELWAPGHRHCNLLCLVMSLTSKIAWKLPSLVLCKITSSSSFSLINLLCGIVNIPDQTLSESPWKRTTLLSILIATLIAFPFLQPFVLQLRLHFCIEYESLCEHKVKLCTLLGHVVLKLCKLCMFNKAYLLEAKQLMQWQAQWSDTADLMKHWVPLAIFPKNARQNAC